MLGSILVYVLLLFEVGLIAPIQVIKATFGLILLTFNELSHDEVCVGQSQSWCLFQFLVVLSQCYSNSPSVLCYDGWGAGGMCGCYGRCACY